MKKNIFYSLLMVLLSFCLASAQEKKDTVYEKIQVYLYENPDKAIEIGNNLVNSEQNIELKIKYYLYLSKAYTAKRNIDQSFKMLIKAQEILKTSQDIPSKIDVLILIAIQYQQMELFSKSFEILDEVAILCQSVPSDFQVKKYSWLGKIYAIKGIIYKSQDNNEIALKKFFTAIENLEKAEQSIPTINNISIVNYNIGYCFLNLKNLAKAEKYFTISYNYALKSKAQSLEAYALKGLAEIYTLNGKHSKAIESLEQAKEKSQKIGDLTLNEGIYRGLAENYLSIGDFDKYLKSNDSFKKEQFKREQSELTSINSFIENMEKNKDSEWKSVESKHAVFNWILILLSALASLFLLVNILNKNKRNAIKSKKNISDLRNEMMNTLVK